MQLTKLQNLNLSKCGLKEYPSAVSQLMTLQDLNLSENMSMKSLPASLAVTNLQKLDLSMCGLKKYSEAVSKLTALQDLNLSGNEDIKSLSASLAQLTNLQVLYVRGYYLADYSDMVLEMPSL